MQFYYYNNNLYFNYTECVTLHNIFNLVYMRRRVM